MATNDKLIKKFEAGLKKTVKLVDNDPNFDFGSRLIELTDEDLVLPQGADNTEEGPTLRKLCAVLLRCSAYHRTNRDHSFVSNVIDTCESPIERLFLLSFVGASYFHARSIAVWVNDRIVDQLIFSESTWQPAITVYPQRSIPPYRVDFLISACLSVPDGPVGAPDVSIKRNIIVECDGHDFHERTKDQAARDKSRDRALQAGNLKVFRFTGSELHKNPVGCAMEIILYLASWIQDKGVDP